jgi:hypothetical protein
LENVLDTNYYVIEYFDNGSVTAEWADAWGTDAYAAVSAFREEHPNAKIQTVAQVIDGDFYGDNDE